MEGLQKLTASPRARMSHPGRWYGLSLGLHLLAIFLLALYSFNPLRKPLPIMIDLTLDAGPVAVKTASLPQPPAPGAPRVQHQTTPVAAKELPPVQPAPPVAAAPVIIPAARAVPESQLQPVAAPRGDAAATGRSANISASSQHNIPAAPAGDNGAGAGEKARQRYLREHFTYIRDLVVKKLVYPLQARKMGWNGKVTVSFVVCEDGSARDLRVLESSGYAILDRCAIETIRGVAPFPKPPVQAEIVLPVMFRLM